VLPKKPTTYYAIALVLVGFCIGEFVFSGYEYKFFVAAVIFVVAMLSLMMGTTIILRREMEERQRKAEEGNADKK
jgi:hypothetical protein